MILSSLKRMVAPSPIHLDPQCEKPGSAGLFYVQMLAKKTIFIITTYGMESTGSRCYKKMMKRPGKVADSLGLYNPAINR